MRNVKTRKRIKALTIIRRSDPCLLFKTNAEIMRIRNSHKLPHLVKRQTAVLHQFLGLFDTDAQQIPNKRNAEFLLKQAAQIARAQMRLA